MVYHHQSLPPVPLENKKRKKPSCILHLPSRISNFRCAWWATDGQQIAHNFIIINARTAATSRHRSTAATCNHRPATCNNNGLRSRSPDAGEWRKTKVKRWLNYFTCLSGGGDSRLQTPELGVQVQVRVHRIASHNSVIGEGGNDVKIVP